EALRTLLQQSAITDLDEGLPPMAGSGLFGYLAYDMVRHVENIPNKNPDPLNMSDSIFMRPRTLIVFDNVMHKICIITPVYQHQKNTKIEAAILYEECINRIAMVKDKLAAPIPPQKINSNLKAPLHVTSNITHDGFLDAVKKAKDYILAGDIFQVVPSQRFSVDYDLPAFSLYRSLRRMNPSPFLFFFQFPTFELVGSSPEILVRVRDGTITIRPIAGTRPRGLNATEDLRLEQDLLNDPKERAEHLMLLDLGRNDVGRVAEIGSVNVTDKFFVEHYSHVMHIVSNVEGVLRPDIDPLDALMAGFPAGTVSGAPKIRAMEIIDELENVQRKFYGGGVGYLGGNGNIDVCIALRTALIKDGKIYIQAGAGIVADSDPQSEYEETIHKAKAIIRAAEDALPTHRNH
ncbi:MAG: anthranilate synthase component I, partial [Pseudomonadota bacterium]